MSTTSVAGESSRSGELSEALPPPNPQPSKIPDFDTFNFSIIPDIIIMTEGDVVPAQAEEPIIDTGGRDISIEASMEKAFAVKPTFEDATQEILTCLLYTSPSPRDS